MIDDNTNDELDSPTLRRKVHMTSYDALLVVSFGGPEHPDHVVPFLENVTRGRNIPRERLVEVGAHYALFDGISPINEQNRQLIAALEPELANSDVAMPIYWGNRNWDPMLADTLKQMTADGVKRAIAFVTSAYSSYSGCRQYRENIGAARAEAGPDAPIVDKLRVFYDHPGFLEPFIEATKNELSELPQGSHLAFTAHSIPESMASGCDYEQQLLEAASIVARACGNPDWELVYQSRSGPPQVPWLEPDICDHLDALAAADAPGVAVIPIGFVSDHLEVAFDLDTEAAQRAKELDLAFRRVATPGTDPRFVSMIRQLIEERVTGAERLAVGQLAIKPDVCAPDCCLAPVRPGRPAQS